MSKVVRKRPVPTPFTEVDNRFMLRAQAKEIHDLGAEEWLAKHDAEYDGPLKQFCAVSSAAYPDAEHLTQMKRENTKNALENIHFGRSKDLQASFPKNVHFIREKFDDTTLSAGFQVEKLKCVEFLRALPELVTHDKDGHGALNYGGSKPLKGGYASGVLYIVNKEDHKFRELEQTNAVFSMRTQVVVQLARYCDAFKHLKAEVTRQLDELGYETPRKYLDRDPEPDAPLETKIRLERVDLLMNWTRNSHYLMHQDHIDGHGLAYLTVIVNITPYASTLLIAGADKDVELDRIGKGVCFPGSLWHRSGETRRGTVKLAFFYIKHNDAIVKPAAAKEVANPARAASSSPSPAVEIATAT